MGDKENQEKKLADEVMMNIACDEIMTDTTAAALMGEAPYPDTVMELLYAGSRACYILKKGNIQSTEDWADADLLCQEVWMDR